MPRDNVLFLPVSGHPVCIVAVRYIYNFGQEEFRILLKQLAENVPIPRIHENKGRESCHVMPFAKVKFAVAYIKNAERYDIPAPLYGLDTEPPNALHASQNFKTVHVEYGESCLEAQICDMGLLVFVAFGLSACRTSAAHDALNGRG